MVTLKYLLLGEQTTKSPPVLPELQVVKGPENVSSPGSWHVLNLVFSHCLIQQDTSALGMPPPQACRTSASFLVVGWEWFNWSIPHSTPFPLWAPQIFCILSETQASYCVSSPEITVWSPWSSVPAKFFFLLLFCFVLFFFSSVVCLPGRFENRISKRHLNTFFSVFFFLF